MKRMLAFLLALLMIAVLSACSPAANAEAGEWEPVLKTIHISGKSSGFDEVDEILAGSHIDLTLETPEEGHFALRGEAIIQNSMPLSLILTGDREGLCFTLPGIEETIYSVGYEVLKELYEESGSDLSGMEMLQNGGLSEAMEEKTEAASEFALRYGEIILSVFNPENMTESEENYTLELLGTTEQCTVLQIQPSEKEWEAMLRNLFTTALSDEQLDEFVAMAAESAYSSARANGTTDLDLEGYKAKMIAETHNGLQNALENVGEIAASLSELRIETATHDGDLCAIVGRTGGAEFLRYECAGTLESGRTDMLRFPAEDTQVILINTVRTENGKTVGRLRADLIGLNIDYSFRHGADDTAIFDINISLMGMTLRLTRDGDREDNTLKLSFNALYYGSGELSIRTTDGDEHVVLPEGERIELTTPEEIRQALEQIGEQFRNADVFNTAA